VSLAHLFIPLCERLAKPLGRPVIFATTPDFMRFMTQANDHRYDIIIVTDGLRRPIGRIREGS